MNLESLKKEVYEANMELVEKQLVISTWGNVSGYDEESGLMVIKPSGVPYSQLKPEQMVPVGFQRQRNPGNRTYSFSVCHHVGAAWYEYSLLRNNPL